MATVAKLLTKNQADDGVKYLLSYLVTWGQYVSAISSMFEVDTGKTLQANGLSEQNFNIYPFTTLFVPLQNSPSSSQTVELPPPPSQQSPPTSIAPPPTQNFSPSSLIGGSVYGGTIKGDYAAIKKMNGDVSKEINLLNKINHLNLFRLSGVCFSDGYWYLVYEYDANGALSDWLYENHGKQKKKCLDWKQRLQIGLDVATGLNYLHSYISPPHVHKNLKNSNVLVDADFRAKISNFGLARSADGQGGQFALTRHIIRTKGYMAPEYLENGLVSTMLDVYSFGVLLLDIFTGKEVTILYEAVNVNLAEILSPVLDEKDGIENLSQIMDSSLEGNYPSELAILLIRLIASCLKKDPSAGPTMHEIVQTLSTSVTTTTS
ncbi:lysM domain receptor-like kinase 4 [Coffea arabica]|uniref:LysM domain receptor-like kinase 4 n=1 Tax=Coffea arabica TaxID=13443 RepID=A0A6P6X7J2_COFAR|nr:lysM domain receptor-like kinase 4 [Coffea arabica]